MPLNVVVVGVALLSLTAWLGEVPAVAEESAPAAAYIISEADSRVDVVTFDPPHGVGAITLGVAARHITTSPDGRFVAAAGRDSISILDTTTMAAPTVIPSVGSGEVLAFVPGEKNLLWAGRSRRARSRGESPAPPDAPTKSTFAVATFGGPSDWQVQTTIDAAGQVGAIAFTPDGKTGFIADRSGLKIVDVATGTVRATARVKRGVHRLLVSPDGQRIYALNQLVETVYVVAAATGKILADFEFRERPQEFALSPDGTRLVVAMHNYWQTEQPGVAIIDCEALKLLEVLDVGEQPSSVAINDAGDRFLIGDLNSKRVTVVDLKTRRIAESIELPGQGFRIYRWPGREAYLVLCPLIEEAIILADHPPRVMGRAPMARGGLYAAFGEMGDAGGEVFQVAPAPPSRRQAAVSAPRPPEPAGDPNPPPVAIAPEEIPGYDKAARGPRWTNLPESVEVVDKPTPEMLRRVAAKRVRFDHTNAKLRDIIGDLATQTGYKFRTPNPYFWGKFESPLSMRANALPLWAVLEEFEARTLIGVQRAGPGFLQLDGPTRPRSPDVRPPLVSGPFRLTLRGGARQTGLDLIDQKPHRSYEASVWFEAEPGLHVVGTARVPTIVEAIDENDQAFVSPARGEFSQFRRSLTFDLRLLRPQEAPGQSIARLAGVGHLLVAVETQRLQLEDLLEHRESTDHNIGGLPFRVQAVEREGLADPTSQRHAVRIKVLRDGLSETEWHRRCQLLRVSRLRLLNAAGNDIQAYYTIEAQGDTFTMVLGASIDAGHDPFTRGDPATLLVEVPTKIVEVDVPFVFKNIPLTKR